MTNSPDSVWMAIYGHRLWPNISVELTIYTPNLHRLLNRQEKHHSPGHQQRSLPWKRWNLKTQSVLVTWKMAESWSNLYLSFRRWRIWASRPPSDSQRMSWRWRSGYRTGHRGLPRPSATGGRHTKVGGYELYTRTIQTIIMYTSDSYSQKFQEISF